MSVYKFRRKSLKDKLREQEEKEVKLETKVGKKTKKQNE